MAQSVYNLRRPLCDFLWNQMAMGSGWRTKNKQVLMLQGKRKKESSLGKEEGSKYSQRRKVGKVSYGLLKKPQGI